tara:strand:- start:338 stop:778 length:441 start_codon:yes stop_codon:yes gene_type:complete
MSEEITKDNASKLSATYYRTVQEACEETRRDQNHSAFMEAEKEKAWGDGKKDKYKRLYKQSSDYTLNVSVNRRNIMISKHDCKVWADPIAADGRKRSGELMVTHVDWPDFMPRKYRYEDSLVFTFSDERGEVLVRNLLYKVDGGEG